MMARLFHVPSEDCSSGTAQTTGMTRLAALSGDSVGSRAIWMARTSRPASPRDHHVESNAHSDEEAVVVIARTTQEAIVENLDTL